MEPLLRTLLLLLLLVVHAQCYAYAQSTCDVTAFGAKGDNSTEDTASIQAAIRACSPGGSVLLPAPGRYLTRSLDFTSAHGVTFLLAPGASLVAWPDPHTWNSTPGKSSMFVDAILFNDMTHELHNVTITGGGRIYGNGRAYWSSGLSSHQGPATVNLWNVTHLRVSNLTIIDSPSWTTMLRGRDIEVAWMTILNNAAACNGFSSAPNTDAFNVGGQDIYIHDSSTHQGDDGIPIFSYAHMDTVNVLVERVNISCGTNGGVIVMGGTGGDDCVTGDASVRNVTFRHVIVNSTDQGAGVKICQPGQSPNGTVASNIVFEDYTVLHPRNGAIYINHVNEDISPGPCALPSPLPPYSFDVQGVTFRNFSIVTASPQQATACLLCLPTQPCTDLLFDGLTAVTGTGSTAAGMQCYNVQNVSTGPGGSSPAACP